MSGEPLTPAEQRIADEVARVAGLLVIHLLLNRDAWGNKRAAA